MWWRPTNYRVGYSLIELLVVIGVITIVGLTSIPSIFNRNDRLALNTSAGELRQLIIDARTRSIAPDKNDSAGSAQQYQVVVSSFSQAASSTNVTIDGNINTNNVSLERGLAQCDSGDLQGGFAKLRNYKMPRGIYISKFYPSKQPISDQSAIIRFTVGQEGFVCGGSINPNFGSIDLSSSGWNGRQLLLGKGTVARYLVIELSSTKISEKRYVALDRVTGEVIVSRSNPQDYFLPSGDAAAPKWIDVTSDKFNLSIACGRTNSRVTIGFPRAQDLIDALDTTGDPNLFVAYDINWDTGAGSTPLAIKYFYDLTQDNVRFELTTDAFTIANQPHQITVTVTAVDSGGNAQAAYSGSDDPLKARQKVFNPSCGNVNSDPGDPIPPIEQNDPGGSSHSCNPITYDAKSQWWDRLLGVRKAYALATDFCVSEEFPSQP